MIDEESKFTKQIDGVEGRESVISRLRFNWWGVTAANGSTYLRIVSFAIPLHSKLSTELSTSYLLGVLITIMASTNISLVTISTHPDHATQPECVLKLWLAHSTARYLLREGIVPDIVKMITRGISDCQMSTSIVERRSVFIVVLSSGSALHFDPLSGSFHGRRRLELLFVPRQPCFGVHHGLQFWLSHRQSCVLPSVERGRV